jgi:hypothetical protein
MRHYDSWDGGGVSYFGVAIVLAHSMVEMFKKWCL